MAAAARRVPTREKSARRGLSGRCRWSGRVAAGQPQRTRCVLGGIRLPRVRCGCEHACAPWRAVNILSRQGDRPRVPQAWNAARCRKAWVPWLILHGDSSSGARNREKEGPKTPRELRLPHGGLTRRWPAICTSALPVRARLRRYFGQCSTGRGGLHARSPRITIIRRVI